MNQSGFSLIELMITVAIVGILAVIAVPQYGQFKRKAMQANAKTILSDIYGAQMAFITEWDVGTPNLRQLGYSQIGEAYYMAGWHIRDNVATGINVNVTSRPASGIYNGPLATDIDEVNTLEMGFDFAPGVLSLHPVDSITPRMRITGTCACPDCGTGVTCTFDNIVRGQCNKSDPADTGTCSYSPRGVQNGSEVIFNINAAGNIGGKRIDQWLIDSNKKLTHYIDGG